MKEKDMDRERTGKKMRIIPEINPNEATPSYPEEMPDLDDDTDLDNDRE